MHLGRLQAHPRRRLNLRGRCQRRPLRDRPVLRRRQRCLRVLRLQSLLRQPCCPVVDFI